MHSSMQKGSLVMITINVQPLVRRTAVRSYVPALCLGTSVPRQKSVPDNTFKLEKMDRTFTAKSVLVMKLFVWHIASTSTKV